MKQGVYRTGVIALIVFVLSALAAGHEVFAQQGLTKIADDVYAYVDVKNSSPLNSFGVNAGAIIGKDGIIVVDTMVSAKEAKRLIRDIRAVSDKPIKYAINTHYHLDHAFGNSEFEKLGAVIVAHANADRNLRAHGEETLKNAKYFGLSESDMEGTRVAYPSVTFNDRMAISTGDQEVQLIYAGPSHTDGSIIVYLPGKKILFAGDALFTKYHPFIAEGNIESWTKVLDSIEAMDVTTIIPGHGPASGKNDVAEMRAYLIAFDKEAKELSTQTKDIQAIVTELKKALPPRPEGEWLMNANIRMRYLEK
jgi:cyclase